MYCCFFPVRGHKQERDHFRQLIRALVSLKDEHKHAVAQLRADAYQLLSDMNVDMNRLWPHLDAVAEEARAASERVHRQLTDAWQSNNNQVLKAQAAAKRELIQRSGMKRLKVQLVVLRSEQADINNQLRHDTMQAAGMVNISGALQNNIAHSCTFHCSI